MKCKYCGAEIANDSVYCEQCGKFTNPFNKKGVTCSMSLVKWLLFGTMVISMVYSYLTSHSYYWSWIPLLISLAIFVVSLVLSIKKKISWVFTVFTFLFFSASATEFGLLVNPDEMEESELQVNIKGFCFYRGYSEYDGSTARRDMETLKEQLSESLTSNGYGGFYSPDGKSVVQVLEPYEVWRPDWYYLYFVAWLMLIIEAGILLLYIIYDIIAAAIARKRIRQS